jgi:hypothetical protein
MQGAGLPDNAGYFHAAYVVAAVVYLGYAALLVRRRARARRALGAAAGAGSEALQDEGRMDGRIKAG